MSASPDGLNITTRKTTTKAAITAPQIQLVRFLNSFSSKSRISVLSFSIIEFHCLHLASCGGGRWLINKGSAHVCASVGNTPIFMQHFGVFAVPFRLYTRLDKWAAAKFIVLGINHISAKLGPVFDC